MHPQPGTAAYDKVIHRDLETNCTLITGVCQLTASEARGGGVVLNAYQFRSASPGVGTRRDATLTTTRCWLQILHSTGCDLASGGAV